MNRSKDKPNDFPFTVIVDRAQDLISQGYYLYQKFTCEKCGQRLTMAEPNKFYEKGSCDRCGHITNIKEKGCNYMLSTRKLPS